MQRATAGVRFAAALIDAAFLGVLLVGGIALGSLIVAILPTGYLRGGRRVDGFLLLVGLGLLLLSVAYTASEVVGRATLGKRLLKLRVEAAGGEASGRGRRLLRWLVKYSPLTLMLLVRVAGFFLAYQAGPSGNAFEDALYTTLQTIAAAAMLLGVVLLVGFLLALGPRRQALHDLIAGTAVFRPGQPPPGFAPVLSQPIAPVQSPDRPADD